LFKTRTTEGDFIPGFEGFMGDGWEHHDQLLLFCSDPSNKDDPVCSQFNVLKELHRKAHTLPMDVQDALLGSYQSLALLPSSDHLSSLRSKVSSVPIIFNPGLSKFRFSPGRPPRMTPLSRISSLTGDVIRAFDSERKRESFGYKAYDEQDRREYADVDPSSFRPFKHPRHEQLKVQAIDEMNLLNHMPQSDLTTFEAFPSAVVSCNSCTKFSSPITSPWLDMASQQVPVYRSIRVAPLTEEEVNALFSGAFDVD